MLGVGLLSLFLIYWFLFRKKKPETSTYNPGMGIDGMDLNNMGDNLDELGYTNSELDNLNEELYESGLLGGGRVDSKNKVGA